MITKEPNEKKKLHYIVTEKGSKKDYTLDRSQFSRSKPHLLPVGGVRARGAHCALSATARAPAASLLCSLHLGLG